jgi:hypothetical protein
MSTGGVELMGEWRPLMLTVLTVAVVGGEGVGEVVMVVVVVVILAGAGVGGTAFSRVGRVDCVQGYGMRGGGWRGRWLTRWEKERFGPGPVWVEGERMEFSSRAGMTGKEGRRMVLRDMERGGAGLWR